MVFGLAACRLPPLTRTGDELIQAREILRQAFQAATEIQGFPRALRNIAEAQVKVGDRAAATITLQRALAAAARIKETWPKAMALWSIAAVQAQAGEFDRALQTAALIEEPLGKAGAQADIAIAQARAGDVVGAIQTAEAIKDNRLRAKALAGIASAQAQAKEAAAARGTIQRALQAAASIEHPFPREDALRDIAKAQAQAGDVRGALHTAGTITSDVKKTWAFEEIGLVQIQTRDVEGAMQTAAAIQGADDIQVKLLVAIAMVQAEVGDRAAAAATVRRASLIAADLSDNDYHKAYALIDVGSAQARIGDRAAASATFRQALLVPAARDYLHDRRQGLLMLCATAQAGVGDVHAALETIAEMRNEENANKVWALNITAEAQAQGADRTAALATLERAVQTAGGIRRFDTSHTPPEFAVYMWIGRARARIAGVQAAVAWAMSQAMPEVKTGSLIGVATEIIERLFVERSRP